MEFREYLGKAMMTCMDTCDNLPYMLFNLQGEVGEISSKVAKMIRKGKLTITFNRIAPTNECTKEEWDTFLLETRKEIGDAYWQLFGLTYVLGFNPDTVAQENLDKLASRKQRGVIDGNGDNR